MAVQAVVALGSVLISALLLTKVVGPERVTSWSYVLRVSVDVVLFFLITHVGLRPALPARVGDLFGREESFIELAGDYAAVRDHVLEHAAGSKA